VAKPFSLSELLARVRALLRRAGSGHGPPGRLRLNDVEVVFERYEA